MSEAAPGIDAEREHQRDINSKALAALVEAGVPTEHACRAMIAIIRGNVPAVSISYEE